MSREDYPLKTLAAALRRNVSSLHALATSADPYLAALSHRSVPARWLAELYHALGVRPGAHIRRIFYMLVSQPTPILLPNGKPFENTEECWLLLCLAARDARYLGLIPSNTIIDRRNPDPVINLAPDGSPAEITMTDGGVERSGDTVYYGGPQLRLPSLDLIEPVIPQRYHLEIWCEKSTMNDVLLPLGSQYKTNIVTGVGEMSATACEALVERARASERPVRILYVSDFDPAGMSMPLAVARKIEFWARGSDPEDEIDEDIQVIPVVLTHDQCAQYRLPRTPLKASDRRKEKFEDRFGEGATELDALEALHPGELRRILVSHIRRYYDTDLDNDLETAVSDVEDGLEEKASDIRDRHAAEIEDLEQERAEITAAGRAELAAVWNRIVEREKAFEERARPILEAMTAELADEAPDAEDFDWPEPAEGEEHDDPLFDSTRSYVDQIERYHAHQGKVTELERPRDRKITFVCSRPGCGKEFEATNATAKACSNACKLWFKRQRRKEREAKAAGGG